MNSSLTLKDNNTTPIKFYQFISDAWSVYISNFKIKNSHCWLWTYKSTELLPSESFTESGYKKVTGTTSVNLSQGLFKQVFDWFSSYFKTVLCFLRYTQRAIMLNVTITTQVKMAFFLFLKMFVTIFSLCRFKTSRQMFGEFIIDWHSTDGHNIIILSYTYSPSWKIRSL